MADDFYLILGIDSDASPPAIRRAYLVRARECHPDKCSDADAPQKFQALSNAYAVLSDEAKRNQYDSHRRNRNSNNGNDSDDTFRQSANGRDTFAEFFEKWGKDFKMDDNDDFFNFARGGSTQSPFDAFGKAQDPFQGFFRSSFPSSPSGSSPGSSSESVSTSTSIRNGKKITVTKRVVTDGAGNTQTFVSEMEESVSSNQDALLE